LLNIEASREDEPDEIPEFSARVTFFAGTLMQEKQPKQESDSSKETSQ
jgi:hypothetical protein